MAQVFSGSVDRGQRAAGDDDAELERGWRESRATFPSRIMGATTTRRNLVVESRRAKEGEEGSFGPEERVWESGRVEGEKARQRQASINNTHTHSSSRSSTFRQRRGGNQALTIQDGMDNPGQGSSSEQGWRRSGGLVGPAATRMDEDCERVPRDGGEGQGRASRIASIASDLRELLALAAGGWRLAGDVG
ncbi:hypothetical protein CORC01_10125 [Colletotrichum orchidophilum]|uniref:Uncharacterized protein n=1 Tax=Colletotrichum orchidophilum TaxID=1209926 RepID=A0A1G4AZN6_9PEZI|nr:uncharacterized protein CORC01_10125 [Colletotrichum orchidophilum]OHE94597.1 hypothetical protein CORC01_10125 [Colletotrichum orchidophilum]